MDDSSPRRRGDVALCCAYVLQGNDWAPVNNSRPDDLTNESRFLAAKIVQDDDMAEAFLELHDYPQTTIIELVVKLKAESRLVKLGGARNAKAHVYELERCCGPDVVALQFADDRAADNFGGLDYLHARDVLHRDIKAANVLLDTEGHAHLCDFGLAKCVENNNQGPKRSFAGTVEYMAPELLRKGDEAPSPALDWWALGVLLVETCQGKTPFRASTPRQLMLNIIREAPQLNLDDEKFRSAVEKLLHKRASRRLRSAAQLAKRRFFEPLDFAKLERKELEPPFTPRAGRVPSVPDQNLIKKFGPHRLSDGDSPAKDGQNSDEVSLSFKGEQFQGFSVFASPAPPVRRKSSKDLK